MVTKSYDHLAHLYQWLEYLAFGRLLHDVREHAVDAVLSKVQPHQHILILGEGDGRFLELFTHKCQFPCRVTCVDKSAQMLAKVQARLQPTSLVDVNLVQADATQTSFDASHYDVIVSLFFLDNFRASTLQALIPNLAESLNNQGIWILADFREITQGSGTWRSRAWLWLMYRFFRLVTDIEADKLTDPTEFLEQTGLNLLEQYSFQNGFIVLETWQQETH